MTKRQTLGPIFSNKGSSLALARNNWTNITQNISFSYLINFQFKNIFKIAGVGFEAEDVQNGSVGVTN